MTEEAFYHIEGGWSNGNSFAAIQPYRVVECKSIGNLKIANFSHFHVFCSPLNGLPLELGTDAMGPKTMVMGLPDGQKSLMISLSVSIQYQHVTDRQTDTLCRQRPRCAEHRTGKKDKTLIYVSLILTILNNCTNPNASYLYEWQMLASVWISCHTRTVLLT